MSLSLLQTHCPFSDWFSKGDKIIRDRMKIVNNIIYLSKLFIPNIKIFIKK